MGFMGDRDPKNHPKNSMGVWRRIKPLQVKSVGKLKGMDNKRLEIEGQFLDPATKKL